MQWCWPSQPAIHAHDKHAQTCHGHVSVVADLCVCLHLSVHLCVRPHSLCMTEIWLRLAIFHAPAMWTHDHDAQRMTSAGRVSENRDWGR